MNQAIIIGATSGIGKEVATRLLEQGWRVGVAGRREQALAALQECYGADRVVIAPMDVITQESVEKLDDLLKAVPSPDLFLYMSGVGYQNVELDEEKELRTVRTNCEGMVRMVDHFLNYVKSNRDYSASRKAHVAVVTSVAGTAGMGARAGLFCHQKDAVHLFVGIVSMVKDGASASGIHRYQTGICGHRYTQPGQALSDVDG